MQSLKSFRKEWKKESQKPYIKDRVCFFVVELLTGKPNNIYLKRKIYIKFSNDIVFKDSLNFKNAFSCIIMQIIGRNNKYIQRCPKKVLQLKRLDVKIKESFNCGV